MIETTSITIAIPVGNLEEATRWYAELLKDQPDIEPVGGIREFEVWGNRLSLYRVLS